MRTLASDLARRIGEHVTVQGWLHNRRDLPNVTFLVIRDRSGTVQVAVDPKQAASVPTIESAVEVRGMVVADQRAPGGAELREADVRVLGAPSQTLPFELFRPSIGATLPTTLDHAAVALRHPTRRSALRLVAAAAEGFRGALRRLGFTEVFTPKIVAGATEGGANCFAVDYFGRTANLAQSPQLYKQILVGSLERVFEVGPVFRAEPHDTPRHLNQYCSLDAEMGFIDDHRSVMAVLREAIAGMVDACRASSPEASVVFPDVPTEIPAIDLSAAQELIGVRDKPDLAPAHERALGEWAVARWKSDFLFVAGFPLSKRPFYTHPDPERPGFARGFDLLFRGLEVTTGGQRLHRYEDYIAALAERGMSSEPLAGYLEAFRSGMPPHGGFAIGLERFVARLLGEENLRAVTAFPRDIHRLTP